LTIPATRVDAEGSRALRIHSLSFKKTKNTMKKTFLALALLAFTSGARAQLAPTDKAPVINVSPEGAQLNISFNSNATALVSDRRNVALPAGLSLMRFNDVSPKLDANSVLPLIYGGSFDILEQTFRPVEGVTQEVLLKRFLGQQVTLLRKGEAPLKGTLLAVEGAVLLDTADGVVVNPEGTWAVPRVGEGLATAGAAALQWLSDAPAAGTFGVEARYLTSDLNYVATYRAAFNPAGDRLSLRGWVSIINRTGTAFRNASLSWGDRKFPQPVTLPRNETRQFSFFVEDDLPVTRDLVFDSAVGSVQRVASVDYSKAIANGRFLLPGRLQLWGRKGEALQRLSEQEIITFNGAILISLGETEGISVARSVTRTRQLNPQTKEITVQFALRNYSEQAVTVRILDRLPDSVIENEVRPAEITEATPKPEITGSKLQWRATIPPRTTSTEPMIIKYVIEVKS